MVQKVFFLSFVFFFKNKLVRFANDALAPFLFCLRICADANFRFSICDALLFVFTIFKKGIECFTTNTMRYHGLLQIRKVRNFFLRKSNIAVKEAVNINFKY